ncbi:hypothetical protein MIND_01288100 [Mycena indigotica]|uniref:Uncharacterized protein n=1 Tax=Mycena indigotica TaxID=2126181 RepID=A0A8H6S509_9AGAR|nr:uncharacterized protein MIND_01288100 [Mycena indigotica]KAF7291430.1 hypothetical protein MIND_01288100 [Mycena indigotica]
MEFDALSQELVDLIVDHVVDSATLKSCALAAKKLCPAAQRNLFSSLQIMAPVKPPMASLGSFPTIAQLDSMLSSAAHLPPYVRCLTLCGDPERQVVTWIQSAAPAALIARFDHLTTLVIDCEVFQMHPTGNAWADLVHLATKTALASRLALPTMRTLALRYLPLAELVELLQLIPEPWERLCIQRLFVKIPGLPIHGRLDSPQLDMPANLQGRKLTLDSLVLDGPLAHFPPWTSDLIDVSVLRQLHIVVRLVADETFAQSVFMERATALEHLHIVLNQNLLRFDLGRPDLLPPLATSLGIGGLPKLRTLRLQFALSTELRLLHQALEWVRSVLSCITPPAPCAAHAPRPPRHYGSARTGAARARGTRVSRLPRQVPLAPTLTVRLHLAPGAPEAFVLARSALLDFFKDLPRDVVVVKAA